MNPAEFMASFRGPIARAVPTVEAIYAAGHWLLEHERFADAAKVFRVMLRAAPTDERGWLALGACHEGIEQPRIALELYGAGTAISNASVRCHLARARVLRALGHDGEADDALDAAEVAAVARDEDELLELVEGEKGRAS
jgi:tetratricopeptide (TPR) repeat protein